MEKGAKTPSKLKLNGDNAVEWNFFLQKFKIFLQASKTDKESEDFKCAVLLNCVGDKALEVYNTFKFAKEEEKTNYTKVVDKFTEFFVPATNETYERHVFFSRDMKEEESVDEYVTQLKKLSKNCKFGNLEESLIKDRLVLGIKEKSVKDRLLRTKNMDLVKAVEICKAAEATNRQLEVLCGDSSAMSARETEHEVMGVKRTNKPLRRQDKAQPHQLTSTRRDDTHYGKRQISDSKVFNTVNVTLL